MIAQSQPVDSNITDTDRKTEALLQLYENNLNKMRVFELETHKKRMSEYMRGRDFLITELYDEIWVQQQLNEQRQAVIQDQGVLIFELEEDNYKLRKKRKRILTIAGVSVGVNAVLILGILAFD